MTSDNFSSFVTR